MTRFSHQNLSPSALAGSNGEESKSLPQNQRTNRREALVAGGAVLAGLLANGGEARGKDRPKSSYPPLEERLLEPADASRPDVSTAAWDPITLFELDGRILQSITLMPVNTAMALGQDPQLFPNTIFPRLPQVQYEETDPVLLKFVSDFLPHQPLCYAMADEVFGGWGGSGMRIALLRMQTNRDTVWISVTRIGFALGADGADTTSIFFSATLAKILNIVYQRASGESLPPIMMKALTGELHIQKELARFDKRWGDFKQAE